MILVNNNDELSVYRGKDFKVSDSITIHQPTLDEIERFGEQEYYSMVYHLTSTPQSMKFQLWDMGVDYTKITPYELFYNVLHRTYSQEKTKIIFGDLDFVKFKVLQYEDSEKIVLYQSYLKEKNPSKSKFIKKMKYLFYAIGLSRKSFETAEIIIDEYTYTVIADYLREVHFIVKDERIPANESTKMILIEDDRDEYNANKHKEYHSQLKNLVSSLVNCEGFKYNHDQVWDMKINAFMDAVKRIQKKKNAELLLQSGYSGFGINLKEIDDKQLNWLGELN